MQENTSVLDFLTENISNYILEKKAQNLSLNSITKYQQVLERFYDFCADAFSDEDTFNSTTINKPLINKYINYLSQNKISPSSQNNYLTIIKNFFTFIDDSNTDKYTFLNSLAKRIKLKVPQKQMPSFSQIEQQNIIKYIIQLDVSQDFIDNRNSLMFKVLLNTGIRISELISIKWSDLTLCNNKNEEVYQILISGKGNIQRYTYIRKNSIENNLTILKNSNQNEFIFISLRGNKCSRKTLFFLAKKLLMAAGVEKSGLHIFRHTFARNLVQQNQNLTTIKELLGHSNISTTAQFYAKADEQAKINALIK